jgi:hypothetical protein
MAERAGGSIYKPKDRGFRTRFERSIDLRETGKPERWYWYLQCHTEKGMWVNNDKSVSVIKMDKKTKQILSSTPVTREQFFHLRDVKRLESFLLPWKRSKRRRRNIKEELFRCGYIRQSEEMELLEREFRIQSLDLASKLDPEFSYPTFLVNN